MSTLKIAVQKSGRLNEDSLKILKDPRRGQAKYALGHAKAFTFLAKRKHVAENRAVGCNQTIYV